MEVVGSVGRRFRLEGHSEVVAERVDDYDHGFVKGLWVPTSSLLRSWRESSRAVAKVDGRDGAFGAVLEDESREEEAAAEEVDRKRVEDSAEDQWRLSSIASCMHTVLTKRMRLQCHVVHESSTKDACFLP